MTFASSFSQGVSYTAIPIEPSDSVDLDEPVRWVDVGTGGDVSFVDGRGDTKVITVGDGYSIKCLVKRINEDGTTASGFIGYP